MWFTTQEQNNALVASIMLKKEWQITEPSFWKREKNTEWKRVPTTNLWTVVSGKFVSISKKTIGEWTDKLELVNIELEDENGKYVVSGSWTQIMRNIVNSLAGTAREFKLEQISIWLYEKAGKDGKMYPRVWVKNNDTQTARLYSIDEQNAMKVETEYKGKKLIDWTKFEQALYNSFDSINWIKQDNDPEWSDEEPEATVEELTKVKPKAKTVKAEPLPVQDDDVDVF